ncbi:hypothetical protein GF389_05925 [Candidatus Dojkabacteria bacterium]|nr:hypothetical protein [Candidatus Dojkabacteria bacterium]
MPGFERERKDSEKVLREGGFKDIRKYRREDPKQKELKALADIEQEYIKNKKPYCTHCAILELDNKIAKINERVREAVNKGDREIKIDLDIDYDSYGKDSLFDFIGEKEVEETTNVNNIKTKIKTGVYKQYVCKKCGSNFSIEVKDSETPKNKPSDKPNEK